MKKILCLTFIMLIACGSVVAQTAPEKITVNATDLTPDQLAKVKAQQELDLLQKKLETYGKWVGVGGEIGNAVKESLNAVVDVADKFGKTDVGKFTLTMVAWKIMGKDIMRIIFGLIFLIIFITFMFNYHKQNFTIHKVSTTSNGWKFWLPKQYQMVTPEEYDGYEFVKWLNIVMILIGFAVTYAIMFAK